MVIITLPNPVNIVKLDYSSSSDTFRAEWSLIMRVRQEGPHAR